MNEGFNHTAHMLLSETNPHLSPSKSNAVRLANPVDVAKEAKKSYDDERLMLIKQVLHSALEANLEFNIHTSDKVVENMRVYELRMKNSEVTLVCNVNINELGL